MASSKTILVPTDFSESSARAMEYAADYARLMDASLLIIYVSAGPQADAGEGMLHSGVAFEDRESIIRRLETVRPDEDDVAVNHRLLSGDAGKEILRVAAEDNVDLIIMATHGHTGLKRTLMGSVAEYVLRRSTCPVMTIKIPKAAT
ncbi:MAG: universal stress protein [Phycisphaerae bacterium]|nr:MAG: universal stress protein [Phycisphaerae bacterium]